VLIANTHRLILSTGAIFNAQEIRQTPTNSNTFLSSTAVSKKYRSNKKKFILGGFQALTSFFLSSSVRNFSMYYLMITFNDTYTLGRTPLEGIDSSQRRLPDNRQHCETSVPPVGFKPAIPANQRPQTHDGCVLHAFPCAYGRLAFVSTA
jgi:hypothetical protein